MNLHDYHRHHAIGSSAIKSLAKDGAQITRHKMERGGIEPPSRALVLGAALHVAIESADKFRSEYYVADPSYKTGDSQKFAELAGQVLVNECKICLTTREADDVLGMANAIREWYGKHLAMMLVESERSIFWKEQTISGYEVECKCRPDLLLGHKYTGETRYDEIKTAADVSPRGFRSACSRYGYPLQQAHYGTGLRHEFTDKHIPIRFVLVQSRVPYAVRYYEIDPITELEASRQRKLLLDELARRMAANDWRDEGPTTPLTVDCGWKLPNEDDQETEGE